MPRPTPYPGPRPHRRVAGSRRTGIPDTDLPEETPAAPPVDEPAEQTAGAGATEDAPERPARRRPTPARRVAPTSRTPVTDPDTDPDTDADTDADTGTDTDPDDAPKAPRRTRSTAPARSTTKPATKSATKPAAKPAAKSSATPAEKQRRSLPRPRTARAWTTLVAALAVVVVALGGLTAWLVVQRGDDPARVDTQEILDATKDAVTRIYTVSASTISADSKKTLEVLAEPYRSLYRTQTLKLIEATLSQNGARIVPSDITTGLSDLSADGATARVAVFLTVTTYNPALSGGGGTTSGSAAPAQPSTSPDCQTTADGLGTACPLQLLLTMTDADGSWKVVDLSVLGGSG